MDEQHELENAIVTVNGMSVVHDVDLAEWLEVDLQELRSFVRMNTHLLPQAFVFSLGKKEATEPDQVGVSRTSKNPVSPVFVFTIHGVILVNACLGQTEKEAVNPTIVRLLSIMKKRFATQ